MTRRRLLIAATVLVAVVALAAIVGPRIYASSQADVPPPLTVESSAAAPAPTATTSATDSAPAPSSEDDGSWSVGQGSEAGYRVEEVLNGQDVTVVGRGEEVSGSAEVADGSLTAAEVTVQVASVATDSDRRDQYFRGRAMQVEAHPTATFTLTEPVSLPTIGSAASAVEATGTLELAGTTRPVTATIQVVREADTVKASGSIPVTFSDFGIDAPDLGFVKVEDSGTVEFLVVLRR